MPSFGRLQEFDLDWGEDWSQYAERMSHHFTANEIADADKKKAILLTACGSATYKLMCDLVVPAKPGDKTFDELKNIVQDHIRPKPSDVVQRFKFSTRLRQNHESVLTYVSQLRHLSQD